MKKSLLQRLLMSLTLLWGVASIASASDRLFTDAVYVEPGEIRTIAFYLENDASYYGFQADISLPKGLEIVEENGTPSISLSSRANSSYSIVTNIIDLRSVRVGAFSTDHSPFSGNSGALILVKVIADDEFSGGELSIKDIHFVGEDDKDVLFSGFAINIRNQATNLCYLPDFSISVGETKTVSLMLDNEISFAAFQTDIYIPDGMSIVDNSFKTTSRTANHALSVKSFGDGRTRLICFSSDNNVISGSDGAIVEFDVCIAEEKEEAGTIELKDQIFSTADADEYILFNSTTKIAVIDASVSKIELNQNSAEMKVGETVSLTATVYPEYATDKTVTWSSSDESVATVSATGEVSAIALGEAVITASNGAVKAECKVTVVATPVESIELNLIASSLKVGEKVQLTATVSPADATDRTVTWSSSDESVATVSATGEVTAVALGEAIITASNGAVKAECKVTVVVTPVESIELNLTASSLKVGEKVQLTATVNPADATDKTVTWRSSDESVATVSATGEVTAVALGEAIITASNGAVKAECKVTVVVTPVESIELNLTASSLKVGEKVQLTATVNPADATDKTVTWSSSDESVATVSTTGEVTAVALGEAVITASNGAVKAECKVTVVATPVESIELNLTASSLKVGEKVQLTATVNPADATDKTVTWSSSDESVATVSATGEVTAVALGEAVITASNGAVRAECKVTVVATPVESIELNLTASSLKVGEKVQLTATVNPADATDKSVTWSSSDESVATVSATGEVTAVAPGNIEIKAEAADGSGCYAICEITVTPAESGIVAVTDSGISVVVDGCVIRITGVRDGERVRVYRENGYLVYDGYETVIDSLVRGLYIVIVGDITMKVVLN